MLGFGRGERDEAGVGVAGFGELGGLGDVFRGDQLGFERVEKLEAGERDDGGAAVGGTFGVGDGQALQGWVAQSGERGIGPLAVFARPED